MRHGCSLSAVRREQPVTPVGERTAANELFHPPTTQWPPSMKGVLTWHNNG